LYIQKTGGQMAKKVRAFELKQALIEAYAVNERMNQYLLDNVDERAWRAAPPGGKGRTIAEIFAHIHNVRHMWLVAAAKDLPIPEKLDRASCSRQDVKKGLARSAECCAHLLASALEKPDAAVKQFRPDAAGFLGYLIAHDAHHRGQICMLARQAGYALPKKADFGLWEWGTHWKELGYV
jgi:uncharacterized damage-inducible protein DinB